MLELAGTLLLALGSYHLLSAIVVMLPAVAVLACVPVDLALRAARRRSRRRDDARGR